MKVLCYSAQPCIALPLSNTRLCLCGAARHEFHKAQYRCACGHKQWQSFAELVAIGAWPGSPDPAAFTTAIDEQTMREWDSLRSHAPKTSLQAYLAVLQGRSPEWGEKVRTL